MSAEANANPLKQTIPEKNQSDTLLDYVTKLLEAYLKIFRLEFQMTLSDVLTMIALYVVLGVFVTLFVIFLSVACALMFSELLDLPFFAGFFTVTGFYLVLVIVFFKSKKFIKDKLLIVMDNMFESIQDNMKAKDPEEYL